jgi:hypothetical protein
MNPFGTSTMNTARGSDESGGSASSTQTTYAVNERVRHRQKPEWGIGTVTKIETVTRLGQRDQRIWIRFPNGGLKTVLGSMAELERASAVGADAVAVVPDTFAARAASHEGGWLGSVAKRKPEDAMTSLPAAASDAFLTVPKRVEFVLSLYRFEATGGKLIDWAVAQSGLDDPLSRFNRHELEAFFDRWAFERDATLARLLQEARRNGISVDHLLAKAPPAAQRALRKLNVGR